MSQEISPGMPVFDGMPEVELRAYASHEQWEGVVSGEVSPAVHRLAA